MRSSMECRRFYGTVLSAVELDTLQNKDLIQPPLDASDGGAMEYCEPTTMHLTIKDPRVA